MSTLTPEERLEFDVQLDALRETRKPGYINVSAEKWWSVIWKGSTVLLTPLPAADVPEDAEANPPLPF